MDNVDMENIVEKIMKDNEVHYFVASFSNWSSHKDLETCLKNQAQADRSMAKKRKGKLVFPPVTVFLVPHPAETHYGIRNYAPHDVDAFVIAEIKNESWFNK